MPTIKEKYRCAFTLCRKRIWVVDLRNKKQYCGDRCRDLHKELTKTLKAKRP
jgi:hypothetical protein